MFGREYKILLEQTLVQLRASEARALALETTLAGAKGENEALKLVIKTLQDQLAATLKREEEFRQFWMTEFRSVQQEPGKETISNLFEEDETEVAKLRAEYLKAHEVGEL